MRHPKMPMFQVFHFETVLQNETHQLFHFETVQLRHSGFVMPPLLHNPAHTTRPLASMHLPFLRIHVTKQRPRDTLGTDHGTAVGQAIPDGL